jgi:hypothetical protein
VSGLPKPHALKGNEPYGSLLHPLAGVAVASGHTLEGRPKLKRGARCVSSTAPAGNREDPMSRERLQGEGRSPDKALPVADLNL